MFRVGERLNTQLQNSPAFTKPPGVTLDVNV